MQNSYGENPTKFEHRKDIDGLRFIAVFSVVAGHYFPNFVPRGYLGVDVFFVISGYVITQLLFSMDKDHASSFLITFYAKRIRRIIPALLAVVTVFSLLFILLVTRIDATISGTGAYSLIGLSNMYLWRNTSDYFGLSAAQNPFTHTWSLGVEEQFYALYPIFFFLCWKLAKKRRFITLITLVSASSILSLILNIALSHFKPNFSFYSMPTRFWEFGVGVSVSLLVAKNSEIGNRMVNVRSFIFLVLVTTFFLKSENVVLGQVVVVAATGYLLFPNSHNIVSKFLSNQKITWIGVRSYSVYLIHWPVLVLTNYLFGIGVVKNLLCILVTVLLSAFMYRVIENPFRVGRFRVSARRTMLSGLPIILVMTALIHYGAPRMSQSYNNLVPHLLGIKEVPAWIPTNCSGAKNIGKLANPIVDCLGGSKGSSARFVYLVGDSHADQLIPMVRASFLPPDFEVRNLNMEDGSDFPYGDFLPRVNSPSLEFIELNAKSGDLVVLAFHRGQLNSSRDMHISLDQKIAVTPETRNLADNLDRFSARMRLIGVKLILVKDTPLMASVQTSQSCALQSKTFGSNGCKVSRVQDMKTRYLQSYAFDSVAKNNQNVLVWDPFDSIYGSSSFFDVVDSNGYYLMWDWNHITKYLSSKLAPDFWDSIRVFINN
jgi:peptidoglycan/LPS O-acetylase OafA/YrhL